MKEYILNQDFKVINGSNLDVLPTLEENSIDAIVTDPPYELGFMNKKWDSTGIAYNIELWKQALRVLKPGGYLLAFGGTRTYHRITCAIEDAGFEIRDCLMWLYGSGFPKSMNIGLAIDKKMGCSDRGHRIAVANRYHPDGTLEPNGEVLPKYKGRTEEGKQWEGWGTALKPAYEPIIMARKPISEKSIAKNILKYGVGGINIDDCRVGNDVIKGGTMPDFQDVGKKNKELGNGHHLSFGQIENAKRLELEEHIGRFPANVITDGSDEVASGMPNTKSCSSDYNFEKTNQDNPSHLYTNIKSGQHFADEGNAIRYFYCAKASKKDRDDGLEKYELMQITDGSIRANKETGRIFGGNPALKKNIHPTVKPVELMQYLIRLVAPKGSTILDIFNGSGSTGKAVAFENRERNANYKYIGIELEKQYCELSISRIDYGLNKYTYDMIKDIKEEEKETGQMSLFDWGD